MQSEFSGRRLAVCMTVGVVIALAIFAVAHRRLWESPTVRAYRLCVECGLGVAEVDGFIDDAEHATIGRKELVELYMATFEDRTDAPTAACRVSRPCSMWRWVRNVPRHRLVGAAPIAAGTPRLRIDVARSHSPAKLAERIAVVLSTAIRHPVIGRLTYVPQAAKRSEPAPGAAA